MIVIEIKDFKIIISILKNKNQILEIYKKFKQLYNKEFKNYFKIKSNFIKIFKVILLQ